MSRLNVDKITGATGTASGAPITLSGDTATLGSSVTVPASIGASLVLLNTTTISTAVTAVSFDNTLITTTYNAYKIVLQGLSSQADDFDAEAEFSNNNGTSSITFKSSYSYIKLNGSGQGWVHNQDNHFIAADAEGVDADSGISGVVEVIINPDNDSVDVHTSGWATTKNQNGDTYGYLTRGISTSESSSRINHIKITDVNSNFDVGKISLYGYTRR